MSSVKRAMRIVIMIFIVVITLLPSVAYADNAPYTSLTVDKDGYTVQTVDGYLPQTVVDTFGELKLKSPSDLFIAQDGSIYIADSGNGKVIACDKDLNPYLVIEGDLKGPTGVYVDEQNRIFVADPKLKKIMVYSKDGDLISEYDTPVSPLFGAESKYAPNKLIVNSAGSIYTISEGNANGILNISEVGDFYGYFGANDTSITWTNILKRLAFTEEQMKQLQKNVPASAVNIDIDSSGLIYTVTQGYNRGGIKKFNMAGNNMLSGIFADELVVDIAVGELENIYTISKQGYIYEYTRDGELLFYFGGNDDGKNRTGLFVNAAAIDVDPEGRLYVLDTERGDITIFKPTQYVKTVHEALMLYQEGFYLESQEPWEEVLSQNSLFDYAYRGISQAYYKLEHYGDAMKTARLGGDYVAYSNSFWEIRNVWLRNNIILIFYILLLFIALRKIWVKFGDRIFGIKHMKWLSRKINTRKLYKELSFLRYMPKNPADAFYGIKREGKVSILSSTIIYILVFIIFVINKYFSGFLFKYVIDGYYDLGSDVIRVIGIIGLCVICNNLICSIRDGEGTFKNIYCGFAYCFMPYVFIKPIVIGLSHILTYNEQFIISFLNVILVTVIGVLIVVMMKEIQCYTLKETFQCIFLTIVTMLILIATAFILFALVKQVFDFILEIYKEGYYRGR